MLLFVDSISIFFYFIFSFFFFTLLDFSSFFIILFLFMIAQILVICFIPKSYVQMLKEVSLKSSLIFFLMTFFFVIRLLQIDSSNLAEQFQFLYTFT